MNCPILPNKVFDTLAIGSYFSETVPYILVRNYMKAIYMKLYQSSVAEWLRQWTSTTTE